MELTNLIKAGTGIVQIISYETLKIHAVVQRAASELKREFYRWDRVEGLHKWDSEKMGFEQVKDGEDCDHQDILKWYRDEGEDSILLLEDYHCDLSEHKPTNIKFLRNIYSSEYADRALVLSQPFHLLPPELEKEVHVMELELPTLADIKVIYEKVCDRYDSESVLPDQALLESALGLTIMEAERAFSKAMVENDRLTAAEIPLVISEKESIIKKSGHLEYYHPRETMKDIGGLENLKEWLVKRGRGFDKDAREFGLDTPKGVLLLGIPGTGKSLSAKAIGNAWHFPLLKLDMGKVFGGIVGESERNIREALKIAEAISPSILWIDEIEKGMSGISSSGQTDGGTTSRVLGTFLTWMQEKSKPVFVVATANNISQLPPELLRKGRVDEIFFVDLPGERAREEIISIHLKKKKRRVENFDIKSLAELSKGFSGAELEEAVKEALFQAYDRGEELSTGELAAAIKKTYPLSKTMHEMIENMRRWAKSRAVYASSEEAEELEEAELKSLKDVPKLKQESYNNPFMTKGADL